jgi:hypothetical protein
MTVLGASALLVAGLMATPAAAFATPIVTAPVASTPGGGQDTCPEDGKVEAEPGSEETAIDVTAEAGYLITGYCVKAGSDQSNDGSSGVEYVTVEPPSATVEISHPSGKAISHYTLITVKAEPSPSPTPSVPGEDTTPEPTEPPTDVTPEPTEPGTDVTPEPTEPGTGDEGDGSVAPAEDDATPSPSASADQPEVLAATGASTAIGITLIALALVGGGVTLIVLRRKGVLGS